MAPDIRSFFSQSPRFEHSAPVEPVVFESPGKFVDLFCGYGGASTGATAAGYDVVLAVDNWEAALEVHAKNHPGTKHVCADLPTEHPLPLPKAGERWHLHGSPPCTHLSSAARNGRTQERIEREESEGLSLVEWFLKFALDSSATSWSMEQVAHPGVLRVLRGLNAHESPYRGRVAWCVIDFVQLGLPQNRKRLLAGTPSLITKIKHTRKRRRAVRDVVPNPRGTHVRNETLYQGLKGSETRVRLDAADSAKPISKPCYTIVAYKPLRWVTPSAEDPKASLTRLTSRESALIQGFPVGYYLPTGVVHATRGIGNAVPPPVVQEFLTPRGRCVSPSLGWRPNPRA